MDRPTPADALLRHSAFVRSLARHLLHDPADQDDAVQETWRASLEHPPRGGSVARAWLSKVLRNSVRQERRGRRRRFQREQRVARSEYVEPVADTLAREEIIRRVAAAVCDLDDPYRTTILLRYYEDLAPRLIAGRMGVPVETVKSRLKRGRARLRRMLEERGSDWRLALAPLAGIEHIAPKAVATKIGVSIVKIKARSAVAALMIAFLAVAGWYAFEAGPTTPSIKGLAADASGTTWVTSDSESKTEGPTLTASGHDRPRAMTQVPGARTRQPSEAAKTKKRESRTVSGLVRVGGHPASGGSISVLHALHPALHGTSRGGASISIGSDGTFRIAGVHLAGLTLLVSADGLQPRTVSVASRENLNIDIARGSGSIWGVAYDALGRPAAGAGVRISTTGSALQMSQRADVEGRYEFRELPPGDFIIVGHVSPEAPGSARNIRSFKVTLRDEQRRRLDIGEPYEDPVWSGVVRYRDGTPFKRSGNIFLKSDDGERRMYVSFDSEGRFSEQVPSGTYRMEFVLSTARSGVDFMRTRMRLIQTDQTLNVGDHAVAEDPIVPGARVSGHLDGHKAGVREILRFKRLTASETTPTSLIGSAPSDTASVVVAEDGTYFIDGMWPGTYAVTGQPGALAPATELEVLDGQSVVRLDLAAAR